MIVVIQYSVGSNIAILLDHRKVLERKIDWLVRDKVYIIQRLVINYELGLDKNR